MVSVLELLLSLLLQNVMVPTDFTSFPCFLSCGVKAKCSKILPYYNTETEVYGYSIRELLQCVSLLISVDYIFHV